MTGQEVVLSVERHQAAAREGLSWYHLPDGRLVTLRNEVARGAAVVSFTLDGGRVVDAQRVGSLA